MKNFEILRLQQLQAIGIASYYPRFVLDGALPSEACEWPYSDMLEESETPTVVTVKSDARLAQAEPTEVRAATLSADKVAISTRTANMSMPALSVAKSENFSAETEVSTALNFQLVLIPVDATLCVLNQIPTLSRLQMQEKQSKLLDNILHWLGKPAADHSISRSFNWPLPGLASVNTLAAAQDSLQHFLQQSLVEKPFRNLLVMGAQATACFRPESVDSSTDSHAVAPAWQVLFTHSLDEMLAMPSLKHDVWQHLLPLHKRLQILE